MEAKTNRHPLRFVSIQADAAAQTAFMLPMQSSVTHGTDRYQTPLSPPYLPHPPEERLHLFSHSGRPILESPVYKTDDFAFDRTS